MRTYTILAIGNSFSEDATHFLHQIAQAAGITTKVVNLYIGGCSLEQHWSNIEKKAPLYLYELNGMHTERYVSINDVLCEEPWDFIITQQASHDSGWLDTYEPFLGWLVQYLTNQVPTAQLCLQETWAYEINSSHDRFARYCRQQKLMYQKLRGCYIQKAKQYGLLLIPCGDVIQELRKMPAFDVANGGISLCRDGFHMSYGYGRYALACTWLSSLFGTELRSDLHEFLMLNEESLAEIDPCNIITIQKIAAKVGKKSNVVDQ